MNTERKNELMARLVTAQNHPKNSNRDIMTFSGFMTTEAELEEYVTNHEQGVA